jgi:hypothetical protein
MFFSHLPPGFLVVLSAVYPNHEAAGISLQHCLGIRKKLSQRWKQLLALLTRQAMQV